MKSLLTALMLSLILAPVSLQAKTTSTKIVTLEEIPATVKEFIALRNTMSLTPEGGAIVMLVALMKFTEDNALGRKFMVIALDRKQLMSGTDYKDFAPGRSIQNHLTRFSQPNRRHIPWTYVKGATPEKDYKMPFPYSFVVSQHTYSKINKTTVKVYIDVYGIALPRPVTLKKNNKGIWKAYELSSLFLDVIGPTPQAEEDDDI